MTLANSGIANARRWDDPVFIDIFPDSVAIMRPEVGMRHNLVNIDEQEMILTENVGKD
jgi:hypothetical protein